MSVEVAWGPNGLRSLLRDGPRSPDALVVVDVLRFTTAVDVAVAAGAEVFPYRWNDGEAAAYAEARGAVLAVPSGEVSGAQPWSSSPAGLRAIPARTRLVLPSPNGAALAFAGRAAGVEVVLAGCLRNAPAVGAWLGHQAMARIGVLAAGERWSPRAAPERRSRGDAATGPLRPAVEDLLGTGAVVAALLDGPGREDVDASPDALAAAGAFAALADRLAWALDECPSGRELHERGLGADVALAAEHGASAVVPVLDGERFVDVGTGVDGVRE